MKDDLKIDNRQLTTEDKTEIKQQYDLLTGLAQLNEREHAEINYTPRDVFQRDYARVLYSPSFRRLQCKMQILGINTAAFYRNRLTHSLEVCQIARSIAFDLAKSCDGKAMYYSSPQKPNDLCCLEAAALCHDIGHPAFGHSGERALDAIAKEYGMRFEGNAQNFRVLRTLEKYDPEIKGLNLTNRTLLAINKYIVREDTNVKKFMFADDYDELYKVREKAGLLRMRTLDVQIIELADDIAYAVHDLEDGLAIRAFNIDELRYVLKVKRDELNKERSKGKSVEFSEDDIEYSLGIFDQIICKAHNEASKSKSYCTPQEYSQVFRKKLISLLTNSLVKNVTFDKVSEKDAQIHGTDQNKELCLYKLKPLCSLLKDAIFECATRDEDIALYEKRGEIVINSLFHAFMDPQVNKKNMLLPPDYRYEENPMKKVKGVIDFIAGMMDTFAIEKYEELFGIKFNEIPIRQDSDTEHLSKLDWEVEKLQYTAKWLSHKRR